jgi:nickel-dependent lactate racemase
VVSAGGAPLDGTFYQSIKGIMTALGIVRPGGVVLLIAALSEGIGSASFEKCLREAAGPQDFERRLGDPAFFAVDQWMVQHLCQAHRRARLWVYSGGLPAETLGELLVEPVASPEAGIAAALEALGPGARVAAIPQGPYVLATIRGEKTPLGWDRPFPA